MKKTLAGIGFFLCYLGATLNPNEVTVIALTVSAVIFIHHIKKS